MSTHVSEQSPAPVLWMEPGYRPDPYRYKLWPHDALLMGWMPPQHDRKWFGLAPHPAQERVVQEDYERAAKLGVTHSQVEAIAMTGHEAVRAWAQANGDYSLQPWGSSPAQTRTEARQAVLTCLEATDDLPADEGCNLALFQGIVRALDPRRR